MDEQKKCDVLVTYCWNRVGYNILRSLSAKQLKVWVADTSHRNICSMSKYSSGSFSYPDPFTNEIGFINCLLEWINKLRPQVLLPTHDEALIIARHRNEFPSWLTIPIADYDLLTELSNKKKATALAQKIGIPTPEVYKSPDDAFFPCVFKTAVGNSAKTVFYPSNKEELGRLIERFSREEFLIEEKCEGIDYSVDCIRYGNYCIASTYKSVLTKTKGGGTSTQRMVIGFPELEKFARQLLEETNYNGVCGIDFKYNEQTGRMAFIEVNARYTGGLATTIAAGFDIPYIHYSLSTQNTYPVPVKIQIGTKTKWILGDLITLATRLSSFDLSSKELKQILCFKGFAAFDDFHKDDKKAFIGELYYYFNKLIKNRKLNP